MSFTSSTGGIGVLQSRCTLLLSCDKSLDCPERTDTASSSTKNSIEFVTRTPATAREAGSATCTSSSCVLFAFFRSATAFALRPGTSEVTIGGNFKFSSLLSSIEILCTGILECLFPSASGFGKNLIIFSTILSIFSGSGNLVLPAFFENDARDARFPLSCVFVLTIPWPCPALELAGASFLLLPCVCLSSFALVTFCAPSTDGMAVLPSGCFDDVGTDAVDVLLLGGSTVVSAVFPVSF
mmetsp:Transcript_25026/g.42303  ORF Transcript_25026/g.42303 Transcript_25026/m.42303 type:complete len:240 (-) Transcript_25026:1248-1967(-)